MFGTEIVFGFLVALVAFAQLVRWTLKTTAKNPALTANSPDWVKNWFGHK